MRFGMMISESCELNATKKTPNLVILPFFKEYDLLPQHMAALERQTTHDFDVIIVTDPVSDEKRVKSGIGNVGFRTIIAKMKEPMGPAGAFFIAEKYALENGYETLTYGDMDAVPIDITLMEQLLKSPEESAKARCILHFHGKLVREVPESLHYYTRIKSDVVKLHGLHYYPMFIGADDVEYAGRISLLAKPVASRVMHPITHSIFANFERSILYRVNNEIFGDPRNLGNHIYDFCLVCLPYLTFGSGRARRGAIHLISNLLYHNYGQTAMLKPSDAGPMPGKMDVIITPAPEKGETSYDFEKRSLWELLKKAYGKKVLLYTVRSADAAPLMMTASELWVSSNSGVYLLGARGGMLTGIVRMIAFLVALPLFFGLGILSFILARIRRPKTEGFGL